MSTLVVWEDDNGIEYLQPEWQESLDVTYINVAHASHLDYDHFSEAVRFIIDSDLGGPQQAERIKELAVKFLEGVRSNT